MRILNIVFCFITWVPLIGTSQSMGAIKQNISFFNSVYREKIFIHHDKPYYTVNDTLWLKGYIVSAVDNYSADSSGIAYVELINESGELIKRISTYCKLGLFFTNITLSDKLFAQGYYTLRAYTNRMQAYGDSLFYMESIKIIDPSVKEWNIRVKELTYSNNRLSVAVTLKSKNQQALPNSEVLVRFRNKQKTVFNKRMMTDAEGNIYIDTLLSKTINGENLQFTIADKKKNLLFSLPAAEKKQQAIDLQFLPEGGTFVVGKAQKLAFKAIDAVGKTIDVKGRIKDKSGRTITSFASIHKGMGLVALQPVAGEVYTAFLDNGAAYPLPVAQLSGSLLQVQYNAAKDSIIVKADVTADGHNKIFYWSGSSNGVTCVKGRFAIKDKPLEVKIAANVFPSGVARFTVYNERGNPVNERALFIKHKDDLQLTLTPHKQAYLQKDSVFIRLHAKNSSGESTPGSFSVAVIDTSQITIPPHTENIMSYLLLSSDIRGPIEAPDYYIKNPTSDATDALLLTQGWVSYDFDSLPSFQYERGFFVRGRVSDAFNKPLVNTTVLALGEDGSKGSFILNTTTDRNGSFVFKDFPLFRTDSVSLLLKATNKKNKSFNIGIDITENQHPPMPESATIYSANNVVFDTMAQKFIDKRALILAQMKQDGKMLEEVIVKAKIKIDGSKNLNKDGGADQNNYKNSTGASSKENITRGIDGKSTGI